MNELWSKARVAKSSARLLLNAGDTDGAVSRAYYAMFDAARVALAAVDAKLAIAKTHQTIIRRFGRHMVIDHGFDPSLGRALNVARSCDCLPTTRRRPSHSLKPRELSPIWSVSSTPSSNS